MENVSEKDIITKKTPAKTDYKIQYFFSKIFKLASCIKKNAPTSSVKQTSKLIEKVTKDDCALKEIPTEIEMDKEENKKSIEIETNNIKKLIREHANLSPVLRKAVHDVVIKNKSVINVATDHKLDIELLQLKIDILKNKEKYLRRKIKYEAAVKFVYKKKNKEIAMKRYGVSKKILDIEIARRKHFGKEYQFDRRVKTRNQIVFTFQEEQLLLQVLKMWANDKFRNKSYACVICALERLSRYAYKLAKEYKIQYPENWDEYKRADISWLKEFEMRHSNEIVILLHRSIHKKDSRKNITDKQQLLSLFDEDIKF
ncbi:uncharacterized protein LOC126852283 [Cataglyphis hispanica]|uniref:uncharacterized protein LOC126852283 n=1 Tax=Cataglyphis hispanica TaxID=1086592 RepID=UPI00217F491B|nr:uncharacterized protein LOC126852283 [Cataglyphis hispanica]